MSSKSSKTKGRAIPKKPTTQDDDTLLPNIGDLELSTSPNKGTEGLKSLRDIETLRRDGLQQVENITSKLEVEAYRLIFLELPSAIAALDNLYRNDTRCNRSEQDVVNATMASLDGYLEQWKQPPPAGTSEKDYLMRKQRSVIPENAIVVGIMEALKPFLLELANTMNNISMWIKLRVPELETGDNFGVEVQGEILSALDAAENSYLSVLGEFSNYHDARADSLKELMAFPGLQDVERSLQQLDARTYLKLQLAVADLRNEIVTIFDLICKNMPKLKVPKTAQSASTYL